MDTKLIGGTMLIVGTSIGAGMLALPVVTAQSGFLGALCLLLGSWLVMTLGALLILEVNLWFPADSNLVSMAAGTLGTLGGVITWIIYLLLLYSLLAAYIAGGADLLQALTYKLLGINLSQWLSATLFLLTLGSIVYLGIQSIDYANRGLMFGKLIAFVILLFFIMPFIDTERLQGFHPSYMIPAVTVVITSFGFATIIPSLRSYFKSDVKKLRQVIVGGSLIPLICYAFWVAVIIGEIPLVGKYGLLDILHSGRASSALTESLVFYLHNPGFSFLTRFFTSICMLTSFLGVALCLADFLADGLSLRKAGFENVMIHTLAFLPPFVIVLFYPAVFIISLSKAGIFCAILLMLLPALMAWKGRYDQKVQSIPFTHEISGNELEGWRRSGAPTERACEQSGVRRRQDPERENLKIMCEKYNYQVTGGKFVLVLVIVAAVFVIAQEILITLNVI